MQQAAQLLLRHDITAVQPDLLALSLALRDAHAPEIACDRMSQAQDLICYLTNAHPTLDNTCYM